MKDNSLFKLLVLLMLFALVGLVCFKWGGDTERTKLNANKPKGKAGFGQTEPLAIS